MFGQTDYLFVGPVVWWLADQKVVWSINQSICRRTSQSLVHHRLVGWLVGRLFGSDFESLNGRYLRKFVDQFSFPLPLSSAN